ncbi:tubulin-specific chaperone C-like [Littorina saxatilis]|uniref:C-CAP/cofactor C-like domain-containing protein n=1 Tax=Littorina saxatilis TaxID=31220 RepID=A0AAN9BEN6_9CAEN
MAAIEAADSHVLEEKKLAVTERLQKRQDDRQAELQKKKSEGDAVTRREDVTKFLDNLNEKRQALEDGVALSNQLEKSELVDHFDSLSGTLQKLQRYVSECTAFLPSYEIRQAQETISNLQNQIQEKRDELLPKKKFAFSKAKKTTEKKVEPVKQQKTNDHTDEIDAAVELAACKFVKQTGQTLTKDSSEINQKDVALVDLTDCTIKLFGAPSAIHMFNLKNCRIFSGPVSGSIFIRASTNCVFVLPCQQLRIHNTYDTDFYIHVTSKAIIEDCHRVRFAPYNWKYNTLDSDYQVSGLDKGRNNWDKVDDFNFLAADVASPNWSVLPESERTLSWD